MRPSGIPEALEVRRKSAARLFERGMKLSEVAAIVGSSVSSAHRWREAWQMGSSLDAKPHPGPKPKLAPWQRRELLKALSRGTRYWGYASSGWTGLLVGKMIERLFGVHYCPQHIPRLLHKLGWGPQKPRPRHTNETKQRSPVCAATIGRG